MTYDQVRGEILLFGGLAGSSGQIFLNDTWAWNGTTWVKKFPSVSPSPRYGHAMVFDPARSKVLLFGGRLPDAGVFSAE